MPRDYVIVDMPMNGLSRFSSLDVNMVKNGRIRRLSDESRLVKAIRSRKPVDYDVMVITEKKYVDKVNKVAKRILV